MEKVNLAEIFDVLVEIKETVEESDESVEVDEAKIRELFAALGEVK